MRMTVIRVTHLKILSRMAVGRPNSTWDEVLRKYLENGRLNDQVACSI